MVRVNRYHRLNMKTYIINGSGVSGLSVAIHPVCGVLQQYRHDDSSLNILCSAFSAMLLSYAHY